MLPNCYCLQNSPASLSGRFNWLFLMKQSESYTYAPKDCIWSPSVHNSYEPMKWSSSNEIWPLWMTHIYVGVIALGLRPLKMPHNWEKQKTHAENKCEKRKHIEIEFTVNLDSKNSRKNHICFRSEFAYRFIVHEAGAYVFEHLCMNIWKSRIGKYCSTRIFLRLEYWTRWRKWMTDVILSLWCSLSVHAKTLIAHRI